MLRARAADGDSDPRPQVPYNSCGLPRWAHYGRVSAVSQGCRCAVDRGATSPSMIIMPHVQQAGPSTQQTPGKLDPRRRSRTACSASAAVVCRVMIRPRRSLRVVGWWTEPPRVARDAALMSVGHPGNHVGTHDRHVACEVVDSDYDAAASAPEASTSFSMLGSRCRAPNVRLAGPPEPVNMRLPGFRMFGWMAG